MRKEDCFHLGYIAKTYSFRGEVIVAIEHPHPEAYLKLESVFVEINNKLVPFFIDKILVDDAGASARIAFEGFSNLQEAQKILKHQVYIPRQFAPDDIEEADTPEQWVGFSVSDKNKGALGQVAAFIDHATNPLLEITGPLGDILVPLHEAFIVEIDEEKETISVVLPEGLIGLNG